MDSEIDSLLRVIVPPSGMAADELVALLRKTPKDALLMIGYIDKDGIVRALSAEILGL